MATTFCKSQATIAAQDAGSQNIVNKKSPSSASLNSSIGSRTIPKDRYKFTAGSTAIFQATFTDTDKPIRVDTGTHARAVIYQNDVVLTEITGELTVGQNYEYQFDWNIPQDISLNRIYSIEYRGILSGIEYVWGREYFSVNNSPQNIKLKQPAYATVDEVRKLKQNIDAYLSPVIKDDKAARDSIIHEFLVDSSKELNGQLNLRDFHTVYNDNFNLYTKYHAIWSIIGSQMGENSATVSDRSLGFWEKKWKHTLKQIKMHSQLSAIPAGRG